MTTPYSSDNKKKFAQQDIIPSPNDVGALANRINTATRAVHTRIDNLISLKMVFALRDPKIYRQGILAFYYVFREFERLWNLEMAKVDGQDPNETERDVLYRQILRDIWTPVLARTKPLESDLAFFYHLESQEKFAQKFIHPRLEHETSFINHINEVVPSKPYLLLAYGHTLYLALFAGGRIMRSKLTKSTGLFPVVPGVSQEEVAAKGTNLFRFAVDDEDSLRLDFKRRYELATRNNLTEEEKQEIIQESEEIFKRNMDMVNEISDANRSKITQKFGYKAIKTSFIVFVILVLYLVISQLRRLAGF